MNIIDIVRSAGGGQGLEKLARSYGLEPVQLEALLVTVVPTLSQRLEANTLSRGGVADLLAQVTRPEHSYLLEHPEAAGQPWAQEAGIGVLDTVFGDKANSRALAARAASQTGVDQGLIQKLLPILASLVMGALAKGSQGGLQDILKRLPDLAGAQTGGASTGAGRGGRSRVPSNDGEGTGGLGDILSRIPGMPGSVGGSDGGLPLPGARRDRGGRTGDWDTPRQGSGVPIPGGSDTPDYGPGSPLPLPGSRVPDADDESQRGGGGLGDIFGRQGQQPGPFDGLPDVVRRGGVKVDGDPLSNIIRSVFGSLLGFQSKGIMGWIIRFLVVRWGWGFVQFLLRRLVGR